MSDNWKHRSKGMRCASCMWFVPKAVQAQPVGAEVKPVLGRCRKHSPTLQGWPAVFEGDWCGDHKLDEEKL